MLKSPRNFGIKMLRRNEKVSERLWRLRGVLCVASVPAACIVLILVLAPRSGPRAEPTFSVEKMQRSAVAADAAAAAKSDAAAPAAGSASAPALYNVVIDAGSTGSRVHIFKFTGSGASLALQSDTFKQLKPGLSAYAGKPEEAAASLKPLLQDALGVVPAGQQASTGLSLRATAGLRLLPGSQAEEILEAVRKLLKTYPFKVRSEGVGIMDGAHEGAYAWLTLNYLLGNLKEGGAAATAATIDLGGGSVQEAFALEAAEAGSAPQGYITTLSAAGHKYSVYVHSYLGYGLMAARARVIDVGKATKGGHPCFHAGAALAYSYGGKEYKVGEVVEAGEFKKCAALTLQALEHDKSCGQPQDSCGFSGSWRGRPPKSKRLYYVSSYFWDRAIDAGIITDKAATDFKTTPADFARRAAGVCGKVPADISKAYASVASEHAPYFCLDLSFCHTVLTQGFDLAENDGITLVKQIKYNGQLIEAAWPLGAAIDDLSA